MTKKPQVAISSIMEIEPYKQGGSHIYGHDKIIKLSSNENPFGPSPNVIKAIEDAAKEAHRYADGSCTELREAIAKHHNIEADNIVCGAGSDELIALITQAYAASDDEILYHKYGFLMYPISAKRVGATPVIADEPNKIVDVDLLLSAVTERTKIIFIANPNNPTASYITESEVKRLLDNIRPDILVIMDAAYAEFVSEDDYSSGLELVGNYQNLVMMRTFSKLYGLGGLRIGWCYGDGAIIDVLNRVRGPFNVSNVAVKAAIAAIEDKDFTNKCLQHNEKWRSLVDAAFNKAGFKTYPSVTNFILVEFSNENQVQKIDNHLKDRGIIGRRLSAYKLPSCMRFTIGTEQENEALINAIAEL